MVVCFLDLIMACFLLFVVVSSVSRKKDKNFYVEQMLRVRRREIVNQLGSSSRAGIWPHPESQILHQEIILLQIRVTWELCKNPDTQATPQGNQIWLPGGKNQAAVVQWATKFENLGSIVLAFLLDSTCGLDHPLHACSPCTQTNLLRTQQFQVYPSLKIHNV